MRVIALVVLVASTVGGVSLVVTWWMTPASRLTRTPGTVDPPEGRVQAPRGSVAGVEQAPLDAVPHGQRQQADALARIHRYGWTDRDRELVSIPIARAIDMAAAGCRPPGAGASAFDLAVDPSCVPPASSPSPAEPRSPEAH